MAQCIPIALPSRTKAFEKIEFTSVCIASTLTRLLLNDAAGVRGGVWSDLKAGSIMRGGC